MQPQLDRNRKGLVSESSGDFPTIIGSDAVFKGELTVEKGLRLLGRFEGEIDSQGELAVVDGASLSGNVRATIIHVDGEVHGNLTAESKIHLTSSARLEGDLEAPQLEVTEGAILVGRVSIGAERKAAVPTVTQEATAPAKAVASGKGSVKPIATGGDRHRPRESTATPQKAVAR